MPENRNRVCAPRRQLSERRNAARTGEPALHRAIAGQDRDHDWRRSRQARARSLPVVGQRIGDPSVAVIWMNLEITDVRGEGFDADHEGAALTDGNASDYSSRQPGAPDLPALALEPVQREEIGTPIDAKPNVAAHRARRGQSYQIRVVRGRGVTHDEAGSVRREPNAGAMRYA